MTGSAVLAAAGRVLRDPDATDDGKAIAASLLSQRRRRPVGITAALPIQRKSKLQLIAQQEMWRLKIEEYAASRRETFS